LLEVAGLGGVRAAPAVPGPAPTSESAAFDEYSSGLASDWMRANPLAATAQQYFSGDEQDGGSASRAK
jgi:hypothetical protein